ncbi:MAG: hypothetical protein AAGK66_08990, partial [Pseudomonadota bacterium]
LTNPGSTNQHALAGVITNLQITDSAVDDGRGGTLTGEVTPGGSTNRVVGAAIGEGGVNGFTWGNATAQSSLETGSPEVNVSLAVAENVPAAALSVTATATGSGSSADMALGVICLEPAP